MTRGHCLADEELKALGVTRIPQRYGNVLYEVPCSICGSIMRRRSFSTGLVYKCNLCKGEVAKARKAKEKAAREEHERIVAESIGTDQEHVHRFEMAASKFDSSYSQDVEKARRAIGKFDSMPEVIACIELLHVGARVIVHQKVGDFTVDFCLPDEKVVVEVDGSLYHHDEAKELMRDYAISHMLGDGWEIRHVPADAIAKMHEVFGRNMARMLNSRREELGMKRLGK